MAVAWESKRNSPSGLPAEIHAALDAHAAFRNPALLLGIVEHRVILDTPKTPSQNDLWCIMSTDTGLASVAVEGKAREDFDKRLTDWFGSGTERGGKERRLKFLCEVLGVCREPEVTHRYQLFHRAASAVLEARRWHLTKALVLVQSFKESATSWQDFVDFATLLGLSVARNGVSEAAKAGGVDLHLAWVHSELATDEIAALAV